MKLNFILKDLLKLQSKYIRMRLSGHTFSNLELSCITDIMEAIEQIEANISIHNSIGNKK